jgi:hypothetical protein
MVVFLDRIIHKKAGLGTKAPVDGDEVYGKERTQQAEDIEEPRLCFAG